MNRAEHDENEAISGVVFDAVGAQLQLGPGLEAIEAASTMLNQWARSIGALAVREGVAGIVLLGMLDAGLELQAIVTALSEHGDLPELDGPELREALRVVGTDDDGWRVEVAASR